MKNGRTQKYRWAKPNLLLIKKVSQLKFRLTLVVLWGLLFLETRCFIFLEKALINNSAFWGLEKNGASVSYLPSNHQLETKDLPQHLILHATVVEDNMR